MGKIKNFQDLKNKKEELRAELKELESVLSFENPRKTFGVITSGATEKYLGKILDSGLIKKAYSVSEKLFLPSLEAGSAKVLGSILLKKVRPSMKKTLAGIGIAILAPIIVMQIKKRFDDFQQRETTKSLSKLI